MAQFLSCLIVPLLLIAGAAAQQEPQGAWSSVAGEFVQQILSISGSPSAVAVNFENLSSLSSSDVDLAKKAVLERFRGTGVRVVRADAAIAEVHITFSEDWRDYLWVANIRQGPSSQVVMRKVPHQQKLAAARTPTLTIKKTALWQQDNPILDFYADSQNLYVLEPEQLSLYGNDAGRWRLHQTLAITHEQPWPRDLRGKLQVSGLQVTAYLPGTMCKGTAMPPAMDCRSSDDPWVIQKSGQGTVEQATVEPRTNGQGTLVGFFSPARNFFTGVLAGMNAASVPPFFSAAAIEIGGAHQWVFAGTDGRARLYLTDLSLPAAIFNDWGSSVAAVQSGCGSGSQVLVTAPGDLTHADTLQAVEFQNQDAMPASATADVSGPIVALWPGDNSPSVRGVVESIATGKYEALLFTIACTQ
ncbi:MAG TPA: hypothetical protein VKZ53_10645 [Candidatus Angelobacter sp.]|nr:hypothetical protein [Candidatus Angelobacter sp.]